MFPRFWYTRTKTDQGYFWLEEREQVQGWQFQTQPVSEAAESVLAANKIVNGEFHNAGGAVVRVFSAKRYARNESESDMFSHTPDRCWTSVGWKAQVAAPEFVETHIHGLATTFERRIFVNGPHRELVYFGALVGGQPLPYRLDQYLSIGRRRGEKPPAGIFGKMLGAIDAQFFLWPWKAFVNRRPLSGPKQFIRISTPIHGEDIATADATLTDFLPAWLALADYRRELRQWRQIKVR
jgi:hypothetical protein